MNENDVILVDSNNTSQSTQAQVDLTLQSGQISQTPADQPKVEGSNLKEKQWSEGQMFGIIFQKFLKIVFWYLPHAIIVKGYLQYILSKMVLPHLRITWYHAKNIHVISTHVKNSKV